MNILLIDDDEKYGVMLEDHFKETEHTFRIVSNQIDLCKIDLNFFSIVIMDHTLQWGAGVREIEKLSKKCSLDFALISTNKDGIFLKENTKNPRITGIFGKYELNKLDSWIKWSEEKQISLSSSHG